MSKKYFTRQEILNLSDIVIEDVWVEAWGGYVRVKSLTGVERDRFERSIVEIKGHGSKTKAELKDNIRAKLIALAVVDEDGKAIFQAADVEALGQKSAAALDTIYEAAQRLSKMSADDVEELAGN